MDVTLVLTFIYGLLLQQFGAAVPKIYPDQPLVLSG